MTASPEARSRAIEPLRWEAGAESRLPTALRLTAVINVVQLIVIVTSSVAVTMSAVHGFWFWAWSALWTVGFVLAGGLRLHRSLGHDMRAPLIAGAATIILGFAAESFGLSPAIIPIEDDRTLLIGVAGLSAVILLVRVCVDAMFPARTLIVSTQDSDADAPRGRGEQYLGLAPRILEDRDALVAAVVMAVDDHDAERVEIGTGLQPDAMEHLSWELRTRGVGVRLPLETPRVRRSRLQTETVFGVPALVMRPPTQNFLVHGAKRVFDVVGSLAIIAVLSPLMVAAAIAIKIDMPGPVFYRQQRIGKDGRPFEIFKFRSMIVDADAQLHKLLAEQASSDSPLFKVERDPRITRLGGMLRRYSIDELPQLFNVLGGSMSLVGPRPQREAEVALYTGNAGHRLGVLPGMTGLWQVSGRSDLSWQDAQELDVYYAHNWSLGFDLVILFRTFRAVFTASGAV